MRAATIPAATILVLVLSAPGPVLPDDMARYQSAAERLVKEVNAADYEAVEREFNAQMRAALPIEKTREFFTGLSGQLGKAQGLDKPSWETGGLAVFPLRFDHGLLDMKIALDGEGRVAGLLFVPHQTPHSPGASTGTAELALPFRGKWLVFWGGDTAELNHHHGGRNQNYAFDFVGIGAEAKTHRDEGRANEDYYAWGREVLAPGDGVVIEAIDGVRDNTPGSLNPYSAVGNAVLIGHAPGIISVLAHLQKGTTRVKVGERVRQGQVIGLCGNSGNTSEPHLHFHVQDNAVLQDGAGMKVFFRNIDVERDGQTHLEAKYSPVKGDRIGLAQ